LGISAANDGDAASNSAANKITLAIGIHTPADVTPQKRKSVAINRTRSCGRGYDSGSLTVHQKLLDEPATKCLPERPHFVKQRDGRDDRLGQVFCGSPP
jgi:hypothetical protein